MSQPESIPPEREQVYLNNAAEVANEASEQVIQTLGAQVVAEATALTIDDAKAGELADSISEYVQANDIQDKWSQVLDAPMDTGVAEGAEKYLQQQSDQFETSEFNVPTQQTELDREETLSEIDEMLAMGEHNELYGLTIDKDTAPHRVVNDGTSEYQTSTGAWIDEDVVDSAHERWQDNPAALQKANWFVARKTRAARPQ